MIRYALYLPGVGYLRFGSYSQASASKEPDPRGVFARRADAERRMKGQFWMGMEAEPRQGKHLELHKLTYSAPKVEVIE